MNIIFMGTPDYAEKILKTLLEKKDINVVAVYTQPDKPVGRKKILTPPPVKNLALEYGLNIFQPQKLREEDVVNELLAIECDYIVVAAYGQILPKDILDHAPCINLHASILPQYRGASPIQQTLLHDDKTTGVTAMLMDEGLDTGDILQIDTIEVGKDEVVGSLFDRLTDLASNLTVDVLEQYESLIPQKQNDSEATHCKKISKENGKVDFEDAYELYNKYRAYTPWPGVFLENGLKLKNIQLLEKCSENDAGKILHIGDKSIVVACTKGTLEVFNVQAPSKKEVEAVAYINGKRLEVDDYFS